MKRVAMVMTAMVASCSVAVAQSGGPSGRGSTTGDPAASSAKPSAAPGATSGASNRANPSGSGTSTSGGRDDNGNQGRDKMPESDMSVKPAPGKPNIPSPKP
jgi:hypothetical protein